MAWSKDAENTTTYLDFGVAPVTGTAARTVILKFNTSATYAANVRMGGWGADSTGQRWGWRLDHSAAYVFRAEISNGYFSGSTTGLNDGAWHTVGFGIPASDNLTNAVMYVDGNNETLTSLTNTVNTSGSNNLYLGNDSSRSADAGIVSEYAEIAVYDRLLDNAEFEAITSGDVSPLFVSDGLILYSPLIRDFVDYAGLGTLTENGSANASISAHPRVIQPTAQIIPFPVVSAGGVTLTVQDATHGHTADNIALTQANQLAVNDSAHAHTADNLDLSQAYSLTVQEALHGHTADSLDLTQANTLALQDAIHAHSADNIVLVQANVLVLQDSAHGHTADNLDLTQANVLAVQEASHAHAADNVDLAVGGTLEVQDSQHTHAADNVALTQANVLVVGDATHAHTADNITLVSGIQLIVQEAAHAHSADNMVLTQANVLAIQDALHAHLADNLGLTQANVLIVSDALHAHIADNIALTIPSGLDIETPYGRVFVVSAQDRTYAIIKSDRTAAIPGDDRTYVIH